MSKSDSPILPGPKHETDNSQNSEERRRKIAETDKFLKQCEVVNNQDVEFRHTLERQKTERQKSPIILRKFDAINDQPVNMENLPVSSSSEESHCLPEPELKLVLSYLELIFSWIFSIKKN